MTGKFENFLAKTISTKKLGRNSHLLLPQATAIGVTTQVVSKRCHEYYSTNHQKDIQVIQAVTFWSPNVGGHPQPLKGSCFHYPKNQQNCQEDFISYLKIINFSHACYMFFFWLRFLGFWLVEVHLRTLPPTIMEVENGSLQDQCSSP